MRSGDHHASTNQVIVVSGQTGETVPLYCTAHGKALLAGLGVAELKAIFGGAPFHADTARTIVTIRSTGSSVRQNQSFAIVDRNLGAAHALSA